MKYQKITGNIDSDFRIHVGNEGLFGVAFFGHSGNQRKVNYIWKTLLKQYQSKKEE